MNILGAGRGEAPPQSKSGSMYVLIKCGSIHRLSEVASDGDIEIENAGFGDSQVRVNELLFKTCINCLSFYLLPIYRSLTAPYTHLLLKTHNTHDEEKDICTHLNTYMYMHACTQLILTLF